MITQQTFEGDMEIYLNHRLEIIKEWRNAEYTANVDYKVDVDFEVEEDTNASHEELGDTNIEIVCYTDCDGEEVAIQSGVYSKIKKHVLENLY